MTMTVAGSSFFSREHYEAQRGLAPVSLCELVVHCLELVAQLGRLGLPFRFKGGNSLLLLLADPQRFSIDVDIATGIPREELVRLVERLVSASGPFTRWEARQPKTKPWLPLASFKLYFNSYYRAAEDAYVMLDAVLEEPPYPGERRQVRCGTLYSAEQEVEVPTSAGLMGDKLLAIGPSTLGIPLGRGKEAQRLKHVFDVSLLGRLDHRPQEVLRGLEACRDQEQRIQGHRFSFAEIAADTACFCREPLAHQSPPPLDSVPTGSYLYEIIKGFDDFREHLFRTRYSWSMLQDDCRRVLGLVQSLERASN